MAGHGYIKTSLNKQTKRREETNCLYTARYNNPAFSSVKNKVKTFSTVARICIESSARNCGPHIYPNIISTNNDKAESELRPCGRVESFDDSNRSTAPLCGGQFMMQSTTEKFCEGRSIALITKLILYAICFTRATRLRISRSITRSRSTEP
jgi:hypothetical protein